MMDRITEELQKLFNTDIEGLLKMANGLESEIVITKETPPLTPLPKRFISNLNQRP